MINYYHPETISSFSNTDLFYEIKLIHEYLADVIDNHESYYDRNECYVTNEISGMSSYLHILEKEWIKRSDDLLISRYNNVDQFLN